MKKLINTGLLLFAIAMIFTACRKDDGGENPIIPEGPEMSFTLAEAALEKSKIVILGKSTELQGFFIDLGDGKFVPISENGSYDNSSDIFIINKPTKGNKLRIKGNVKGIEISSGNIVSMDVSQNIFLEKIAVRNTISTFAQLDLTKNTELKEINFFSSGLASLDLRKNTKLVRVEISKSPLKQINFPTDNQIETIRFTGIQLPQIDISQSKKLAILSISESPLTTIDLSKNTLLRTLGLVKTNVVHLNVSANPNLIHFWVSKNKIGTLVLPASFPKLIEVSCNSNQLGNAQMDALANTLPTVVAAPNAFPFVCIDRKDAGEKNVISVAVVNKIKAKGWKVYDANNAAETGGTMLEYPGS